MDAPELSIIIPTLDEAGDLPHLLADLGRQTGVACEVLVVDGGSADGTPEIAARSLHRLHLPGRVIAAPRGRGRQLNRGAGEARSDWLLFLHADCRLPAAEVLADSLEILERELDAARAERMALGGHLTLSFRLAEEERSLAYLFYESKARTGRPGTIHGDQGFWVRKEDFFRLGGFREDLPVLEDTSFARTLADHGRWLLLPGRILTSARRFRSEGLDRRQLLNALMMNFLAVGWRDFFTQAPHIYREQPKTRRLELLPFFNLIKDRLALLSMRQRWTLWLATGRYVRCQTWQIGLFLDCREQWQRGRRLPTAGGRWLARFDRWIEPLINHRGGDLVSAVLVKTWFELTVRRLRVQWLRSKAS